MDYGGVNTVCLNLRRNPNNRNYYLTNEYHEGGRTAKEHTDDLRAWNCGMWRGGAKSEGQWRDEFRAVGLPVGKPAVSDVWVGINRVYGVMKQNRLYVFDTCQGLLGQIGTYSRKMNKATGEPIPDQIANKNEYHYLDARRYILSSLEQGEKKQVQVTRDAVKLYGSRDRANRRQSIRAASHDRRTGRR
jgi:hypothetical protein